LAIGISGLCLVHCFASVLVLALLSSVGGFLLNPLIHEVGLGLAVLIGLVALVRGVLDHGAWTPLMLGGVGLAIMAAALTMPHGGREAILTMIGVALVGLGHFLNRRAAR
jgi:hypothetical protein